MKLEINEEKTKVYDLTREKMKYSGYDFYVVKKHTKNPQQKGKFMVTNELPKSKEDEIVKRCRELLHSIRNNPSFETIHAWNTYVVGVHNYYKGMSMFCKSFRKVGWRIKELFYHTMSRDVKFTEDQTYKDMLQFLHDHPHITQVSLCLDNDKAGIVGMERLEDAIRENPELSQRVTLIYHNPPPAEHGKDYNEFLCAHIKANRIPQKEMLR